MKQKNYLLEEIENNDLISEKYKRSCKYFHVRNYLEHVLILASTVTSCVSISGFTLLIAIPLGITSPVVRLKICSIITGVKKYKSIIQKKKKHNKIVLLGKNKLNAIDVLVSKHLIDLYISHDEFVSVNNVLREYNEMKHEIKTYVEYTM